MDKLTFILILAGIGIILLVAMFTYYKHHKKIKDEIDNFNHHSPVIDDVLLQTGKDKSLNDDDLPGSFRASREDGFDVSQVNMNHEHTMEKSKEAAIDKREMVDGVYINSKRVISQASDAYEHPARPLNSRQSYNIAQEKPSSQAQVASQSVPVRDIKLAYDAIPEGVEELIISHCILSKDEFFSAQQLFDAFKKVGLLYGEMNIFHFPGDEQQHTFALFSVANVVEPGTFDLQDTHMKTPGVSLFMRLPTRIANFDAYEKLLEIAHLLSVELNGELCDETRSQLTQQTVDYKKDLIKKLNFDIEKAKKIADLGR